MLGQIFSDFHIWANSHWLKSWREQWLKVKIMVQLQVYFFVAKVGTVQSVPVHTQYITVGNV